MTRAPEHTARLAAWNEHQRNQRSLREWYRAIEVELDTFAEAEGAHDLWWTVAFRDHKSCRLCQRDLLLDQFDKGPTMDRLKHECKRCAYERYVKPRLGELCQRVKAWARANPESVKASRRKQAKRPQVRLRTGLMKRLKTLVERKTERFNELIGCTPTELVQHIESLFQPGMSWANQGEWHVDHRLPCRSFDLSVKEERLRCFHYTNLQPLWGKDNLSKSDLLPDGTRARESC